MDLSETNLNETSHWNEPLSEQTDRRASLGECVWLLLKLHYCWKVWGQ